METDLEFDEFHKGLAEVYSWVSDEIDAEAKGDVVENMRIWGEVVENAYGPNLICCKRWNSTCSFPSQH